MIYTITLGVVRFASVFGLCENGCGAHAFIQPAHHCLAGSRVTLFTGVRSSFVDYHPGAGVQ